MIMTAEADGSRQLRRITDVGMRATTVHQLGYYRILIYCSKTFNTVRRTKGFTKVAVTPKAPGTDDSSCSRVANVFFDLDSGDLERTRPGTLVNQGDYFLDLFYMLLDVLLVKSRNS